MYQRLPTLKITSIRCGHQKITTSPGSSIMRLCMSTRTKHGNIRAASWNVVINFEVCCFQVLCTFRRPCLRHPNVLPDLWCKPKRQSKTRRKKCHFASNKTTKQTNKTKTILSSQRKGDQSGLDHIAQGSVDRRPTSSLLLLGIKTAAPPDSISCSSSTVVVMVVVVVG